MDHELESRFEAFDRKLDRVIDLMHGDDKGNLGIVHKVEILWRVLFIWPIATASALAGVALTIIVQYIIKNL